MSHPHETPEEITTCSNCCADLEMDLNVRCESKHSIIVPQRIKLHFHLPDSEAPAAVKDYVLVPASEPEGALNG